ncbi:hypothetical protein ZWY2020_045350 [Hordeum vulgare]|nr:hypothetical protein ZWY2020_045350 [Hordeum vulgare]
MPSPSVSTWFHVPTTANPPQANSVTCRSSSGSAWRQIPPVSATKAESSGGMTPGGVARRRGDEHHACRALDAQELAIALGCEAAGNGAVVGEREEDEGWAAGNGAVVGEREEDEGW